MPTTDRDGPGRDGDQPVWSEPLVRDVTTNVLRSLLDSAVLRPDLAPGEDRAAVTAALAAAGITPGAIR